MMDSVVIGGFMFCHEHGCEYCNKCYCDHRMCNNMQILDKLSAAFPDLAEDDFLDRPPLSDALNFGVESKSTTGRKDGPFYQCKKHEIVDCSQCFDWAKLAIAKMKHQAKMKNPNAIEVKTTRDEKLRYLAAMGVELSPTTRLPEHALQKRLRSAIDACQYFAQLVDDTPLNPSSLPFWSPSSPKTNLLESVRRGNMAEAMKNVVAKSEGGDAFPLYSNPFMDVRQTVMSIANFWDENHKHAVIQDKGTDYAICIRILEVRVLAGVPMLTLLYGRGTRNTPINTTLAWLQEVVTKVDGMLPQIVATPEEQNLLLMILNQNAKRLSPDYRPKRMQSEKTFSLSFIIPVGPLDQQDVGKLTHHSGCTVCGNKTASKCSQCLSVEYCGAECQKAHWKEHKPMCNSLKGAKWHTVKLSLEHEVERAAKALGEEMHMFNFNSMASWSTLQNSSTELVGKNDRPIPPNIHGDRPFLIKIQRPLSPIVGGSMMIYDRQRSIQGHMMLQENPETYFIAMGEMETGPMGLKIYRWAKRTGDLQLSVCFNKAPAQNPQW